VDQELRNENVLPDFETPLIKPSPIYSLIRLFAWIRLIVSFVFGNQFDRILRKHSEAREAVRLRNALERAGGTFVKFGQQAAMRIDLLPWAYCVELSKMLDKMVPFPVEKALEAVTRSTGKPWQETFAVFDPEPIGSASIACVYQAVLKDGTRVAVKVRRPNIHNIFTADFKVLDWLANLMEFLTFMRPGFTRNLRKELSATLLEELDFRREARFQDTFRRNAKKSGKDFFTAPRVYFELSGEDVLVQEFVEGLWLWEVISAVEHRQPEDLQLLRSMNIDPEIVARRIMWTAFWSMDEHLFFHADPHPANILVRKDNNLTLIDFGSCGSFNNQQRVAMEQLVLTMEKNDVEGMALASLSLIEPMPPVDLPALIKTTQEDYMRVLQTFNTPAKYTEYWERTTARQWIVLVQTANRFQIPLNLHMLRMIRATLLYDSIVLRLDNRLDRAEEYAHFMKDRARLVKDKWRKRIRQNAGDRLLLRVEELSNSVNDLMLRTQSTLGKPIVKLGATVDKLVYTASVLTRMVGRIAVITFLAVFGVVLAGLSAGESLNLMAGLTRVIQSPFYQLILVLAAVLNLRLIVFRLWEKDTATGQAG
jgi:ubiquinone biosynthesis protein